MANDEATQSPRRRLVRTFAVSILALWSIGTILPSVARLWDPLGAFGFTSNGDGIITSVAPNSTAAAAGLKPGDRIDVRATDFENRRYVGVLTLTTQGRSATFQTERNGRTRAVTLVARPELLSTSDKIWLLIRQVGSAALVAIGAALVLVRPSLVTWAFFLYALGANFGSHGTFWSYLPAGWFFLENALDGVAFTAGFFGFLIFALLFPQNPVGGWRRSLLRAAWYPFAALALATAYNALSLPIGGLPSEGLNRTIFFILMAIYVLATGCFLYTYFHSTGEDRQRMKWVIVGFAVGVPAFILASLLESTSLIPWTPTYGTLSFIYAVQIVVPITVAYAVIRHRVIDVNFVISRAVVYAILTSLLVGVFALIDWLFTKKLESANLGLAAEVGTALALGYWLNGLHSKTDRFVDGVFFHRRHLAERRLARAASALPHAGSEDSVNGFLVREPVEAFELASAAVFRRGEHSAFARCAAFGWADDTAAVLEREDPLVIHAQAAEAPFRMREIGWARTDLPSGPAGPALVVPIAVRRQLVAIALYGAHANGADLDPDEDRAIASLAVAAGVAVDHLEAEALRREIESMRVENAAIRRDLTKTAAAGSE